jgi:hypothetical protein
MPREKLPGRRRSWTQKVRVGGQTFYASFSEYPDGRLGEVFIEAHKEGTFTRGILSALARTVSVALQSGVSPAEVVKTLRGLNFPPRGAVEGSAAVRECSSVPDWLAQEIEAHYAVTTAPADVEGSSRAQGA